VKVVIVALVKVGNVVKIGNANTTSVIPKLIYVTTSYFVGIVLKSSIKVYIYLNFDFFKQ
jgi:hypothetical protein